MPEKADPARKCQRLIIPGSRVVHDAWRPTYTNIRSTPVVFRDACPGDAGLMVVPGNRCKHCGCTYEYVLNHVYSCSASCRPSCQQMNFCGIISPCASIVPQGAQAKAAGSLGLHDLSNKG